MLNGKSAVFESQSGKFEFTENGEISRQIKTIFTSELHKTRSKPIYIRAGKNGV